MTGVNLSESSCDGSLRGSIVAANKHVIVGLDAVSPAANRELTKPRPLCTASIVCARRIEDGRLSEVWSVSFPQNTRVPSSLRKRGN